MHLIHGTYNCQIGNDKGKRSCGGKNRVKSRKCYLSRNMKCLIEDEQLTVEMGSKAKEMALKEFTIEKSIRNIVEALKPLT